MVLMHVVSKKIEKYCKGRNDSAYCWIKKKKILKFF